MAANDIDTGQAVQDIIESTCRTMIEQLETGDEELAFKLRRRRATRTSQQDESTRAVTLSFPGKTAEDAWRFTVVLRILQIVHEALTGQIVITKRDIYYRDPALFGTQAVVDRYIEDIALTFQVSRAQLNVTAAAKGLLRGPMTIQLNNGTTLDAMASRGGLSVPAVQDLASCDLRRIRWVLVIEKEATFHALLSSSATYDFLNHGLIVTAKGYPDVATRQLLQWISARSALPMLALVDYDPDGLAIYSNYKYGPTNQMSALDVTLPSIRLLGLASEHLNAMHHNEQGTLVLTSRDRKRAVNMLRSEPVAQEEPTRLDLQRMLMLNIKAELQHLDTHNLVRLLYNALSQL